MGDRVQVGVDLDAADGARVRLWVLQLGGDPVPGVEARERGLPMVPQHPGVPRAEVAAFVHSLRGVAGSRGERFDDHGSGQSWPRGSY